MSLLADILSYNRYFVEQELYKEYTTTKFPDKKMVILTCMDTRLIELLLKAMNVKNGDVKVIKNAGAILSHPFGSIMRSLLVAVYELQAEEVFVIGHYDCGMSGLDSEKIISEMKKRGISEETIDVLNRSGIRLNSWLKGFRSVEESVTHSVRMIREHPLMDKSVPVHGLVIDPDTGKLDLLTNGYNHIEEK